MELQKLLKADYLDILFDGRNKKYGGYELRRKYGERTRKATASVFLGVTIFAAIPLIAASLSPDVHRAIYPVVTVTELTAIPKDLPKPIKVTPPAPSIIRETIANPIPKIEPDEKVTEAPKTVDDIRGKEIAMESRSGLAGGPVAELEGPAGPSGGSLVVAEPPKRPFRTVDQMPAFDGDLNQYLVSHTQYPDDARSRNDEGRVGIEFVVNEDGSISDVVITNPASASLNAEALRVVRNMPKWKPGKQNGKPVKVYFKIPIAFRLD